MNTQRAHEPFWQRIWPWRREEPPSSNWQCSLEQVQRHQNTDEVPLPREQNTDGIRYPLHQHEQPELPDQSRSHRWPQWYDQQPTLCPRLIEETGPKKREQLGHIQEIRPQIVAWQPSPIRSRRTDQESEPIARVSAPNTPIPDAPDSTRDFNPGDLPDFVRTSLPELPVQRDFAGEPIVRKLNPVGNLATMRPRSRRYELEKPQVDELPTVPDTSSLVRAYMTALPPWHPAPPPVEPPMDWLTKEIPEVEMWAGPEIEPVPGPQTDAEIPTQKLERKPLKANKDATASREFPALWQWELMLKQKGSEK